MAMLNVMAKPGSHALNMSRDFDAPRHLVFKAFTDPALIPKWWGPSTLMTVVDKMEVKQGGVWRFIQRDAQGNEFSFHGVYHAIVVPERTVSTFEFEGMPGHVVLETVTFREHQGKTTISVLSVFQTIEDRDGMIASGMESGTSESWDRFEELLKTL
jgi:uncharacterized protein YndB with AHSA1/START domain